MRIILSDKRKGFHKIKVESLTDLWELSHLLKKGDMVEATTFRTFRVGSKEEKKKVRVLLEVEDVSFSPYKGALRIKGIIREGGPEEYIQKGRYHSIDVREGDVITVYKTFSNFEWKRLQRAIKESRRPLAYILAVDVDGVRIFRITPFAVEEEAFHPFPSKRLGERERLKELEYIVRNLPQRPFAVVGNAAFAKSLVEKMKAMGKLSGYVETSESGWDAVKEALQTGKLKALVGELKAEEEMALAEELGRAISRGRAAFGEDVEKAVEMGAVEKVLVHESLMRDEKVRRILEEAEKRGAYIHIFSDTPWGEQVKLLGGLVAILRFGL